MSKLVKAATVAVMGATLTGLLAGSANAAASPVLAPAIGLPTSGTHRVVPNCYAGPGVSTTIGYVTYTIYGTATAAATNGSVAVATGVTCWVSDWYSSSTIYGSKLSQALPGAAATVAGTVTVPFNSYPRLCAAGNALFTDNVTASTSTC